MSVYRIEKHVPSGKLKFTIINFFYKCRGKQLYHSYGFLSVHHGFNNRHVQMYGKYPYGLN